MALPPGLPDRTNSYAFLVGTYKYEPPLENLPGVEHNLSSLGAALTDPMTGGFPEDNCTVLLQPDSEDTVLARLAKFPPKAADILVFYFAGHGFADPYSDELYLGLPGTRKHELHTALRYEWVRRRLRESTVQRKIVILDACFAGRAIGGRLSENNRFSTLARIDGVCTITATAKDRTAHAPGGEKFTAFTGALMKVFSEGIPDAGRFLDVAAIYAQVYEDLLAKSRPLPDMADSRIAARTPLVVNHAFRASMPAARQSTASDRPWSGIAQLLERGLDLIDVLIGAIQLPPKNDEYLAPIPEARQYLARVVSETATPVPFVVPESYDKILALAQKFERHYEQELIKVNEKERFFEWTKSWSRRSAARYNLLIGSLLLAVIYRAIGHDADVRKWQTRSREDRQSYLTKIIGLRPSDTYRNYSASVGMGPEHSNMHNVRAYEAKVPKIDWAYEMLFAFLQTTD